MTDSEQTVAVDTSVVPHQEEEHQTTETRPTQASLAHGLRWLTSDGSVCSTCSTIIEGQHMLDRSLTCGACGYVACAVCLGQQDAEPKNAVLRAQVDADVCIMTARAVTYDLDDEEMYYNLENYFRNLNTENVEVQKAMVATLKARKQFCSAITTHVVDDKGIDHTQKLRMVVRAMESGFRSRVPDFQFLEEEPK